MACTQATMQKEYDKGRSNYRISCWEMGGGQVWGLEVGFASSIAALDSPQKTYTHSHFMSGLKFRSPRPPLMGVDFPSPLLPHTLNNKVKRLYCIYCNIVIIIKQFSNKITSTLIFYWEEIKINNKFFVPKKYVWYITSIKSN